MNVCRTVKSLCAANKDTRNACREFDTATWKQMLQTVFAPRGREKFNEDNVLEEALYDESRPRASFYKLCTAFGLANALSKNFAHSLLTAYKRELYNEYVLQTGRWEALEPTAEEYEKFDYEFLLLPDLKRIQSLYVKAREEDRTSEFKNLLSSYYHGDDPSFKKICDVLFAAVIRTFVRYMKEINAESFVLNKVVTWLDDVDEQVRGETWVPRRHPHRSVLDLLHETKSLQFHGQGRPVTTTGRGPCQSSDQRQRGF